MMVNRRMLISFDWLWFLSLLLLAAAGLTAIWSTTEGNQHQLLPWPADHLSVPVLVVFLVRFT